MPPQNTPQYDPREQAFIDTLNAAPTGEAKGTQLSGDRKQALWDAYHFGSNEKEWIDQVNKSTLDNDTKQDLYNFRFKGIGLDGKPIGQNAPQAASSQPGATSVSAPTAQPPTAIAPKPPKTSMGDTTRQMVGKLIPDGSEEYLQAANKLLVEPFEKLSALGAEAGAATVQGLVTGRSPYAAEARHQLGQDTTVEGVARGVGEVAGGVITDPRQWPLMGEAAAKMAIGKWISRGFAAQMGEGTVKAAKNLYDNWSTMTPAQRAESITTGGLSGIFTAGAAAHGFGGDVPTTDFKDSSLKSDKIPFGPTQTGDNGFRVDPKANRVDPASQAEPSKTSTQVGPTAQDVHRGAQFTTQAPEEARSEQTTQANKTFEFKGADGPMRPWDPDGTRFSRGGTIGMNKVDTNTLGMEPASRSMAPEDVVAPEPTQASQGADYRPQYTYKPSEKVALSSESVINKRFADDNEQSFREEIKKNQAALRNSTDPVEQRIANERLRDAKDGLARVIAGGQAAPEDVIAPKPSVDEGPKSGGPVEAKDLADKAGLVYKDEVVPGTGIHQFEDPSAPGKTMAVKAKDLTTPEALRSKMDQKLKELQGAPDARTVLPVAKDTAVSVVPIAKVEPAAAAKSVDLPKSVYAHIDKLVDLARQYDGALTDTQRERIETEQSAANHTKQAIATAHFNDLNGEQRLRLRDSLREQAAKLDARGNAMRDLTDHTVKNADVRGTTKEGTGLQGLLKEGNKFNQAVDPETGIPSGQSYDPARVVKRSGRTIMAEMQGKIPRSSFDAIVDKSTDAEGNRALNEFGEPIRPSGLSDAEWNDHVAKLKNERTEIKKKITSIIAENSRKGIPFQETEMEVRQHLTALQEMEDMFKGRFNEPAARGRLKNIPAELDENGAIKFPEALPSWSLERQKLALGLDYLRQKFTNEEMYQHADTFNEKALHLKDLANQLDTKIADAKEAKELVSKQRGAVGEVKGGVAGGVYRSSLMPEDITPADAGKRATRAGFKAWPVTDERPSGIAGFLSPDGKVFIDKGQFDHDDVAEAMYPEHRNPMWALLTNGWIRKVTPTAYEAWRLDTPNVKAIEMDLIRGSGLNTKWGEEAMIDTKAKASNEIQGLNIERGWINLEDAIIKAKKVVAANDIAREAMFGKESGKIAGIKPLAGAAAGAVVGGVAGHVVGGPVGAMVGAGIGWGAGFLSPAIRRSPVITQAFSKMLPITNSFGIKLKDWLVGHEIEPAIHQELQNIRDAQQRDMGAAAIPWLRRLAQLPSSVYTKWGNSMFLLSDRPGGLANQLAKFDPQGKAFRDLKGNLTIDESPFAFAMMATSKYSGMRDLQTLAYRSIVKDAVTGDVLGSLRDYLNLKGYQRVWDVMNEKMQNAQNELNTIQTKLKGSNLGTRERVGLEDDEVSAKAAVNEIQKRMTSNELTPENYDPQKIQSHLGDLQTQMSQEQWAKVQSLAQRVFKMNRDVLDSVHKAGIISDDDYNTYTARGNEYIPMHRILEDANNLEGATMPKGNPSPLYLRQQNVIRAMDGSDKINRDPLLSSADANNHAMQEVVRNDTIGKFLELASQDPMGVGTYFTPVAAGYKAGPTESLVGHYKDGKPTTYVTPAYIGEALKSANPVMVDMMGKAAMRLGSRILRESATAGNLMWSLPNAARHMGDMAILSKAGIDFTKPGTVPAQVVRFGKAYFDATMSTLKKDASWQEMIRSGAAYGALQRNITPESQLSLETLGFAQRTAHTRVVDSVAAINRTIEDITKLTAYSRLRQAGMTEHAAAYETKRFGGGPDFGQMGTEAPAANLAFMFFNARLRYVGRVFERAQDNPGKVFAAIGTIGAMAMTAMMWNLSQKDEKGEYLLRRVPPNVRENNFIVLYGNDTYESQNGGNIPYYLPIPKPAAIKFLWNPIENAIGKMIGVEDRTGTQLGLDAINALIPGQGELKAGHVLKTGMQSVVSSMNPILKTGIEEGMNMNMGQGGKPIVPERMKNVEPAQQFSRTTPEIYKRMGQGGLKGAAAGAAMVGSMGAYVDGGRGAIVGAAVGAGLGAAGISPLRDEHIVDSFTAGVGRTTAALADKMLKQNPNQSKFPFKGQEAERQGVSGVLMGRFLGTPVDQTDIDRQDKFYDNIQKAAIPQATLKQLQKTNPTQALLYYHQNKEALHISNLAPQMQKSIGELNSEIDDIQDRKGMDDDAKMKRIAELHDRKQRLLDMFNRVLEKKPGSGAAVATPGGGNGNAKP